MEEILFRFPLIGDNIFKELKGRDFCKSMEVSRSWNYFINNERILQKAYKKRMQDKIEELNLGIRARVVPARVVPARVIPARVVQARIPMVTAHVVRPHVI